MYYSCGQKTITLRCNPPLFKDLLNYVSSNFLRIYNQSTFLINTLYLALYTNFQKSMGFIFFEQEMD